MKKYLLILSAGMITMISSCNDDNKTNENKPAETKKSDAMQKNLAAFHATNTAVETGDVSRLGDYIAADAVDHAGEKGDVKGLDNIKAELAGFTRQASDIKGEIIKEFADEEYVIAWMRYSGIMKVQYGSIAPGTKYDMTGIEVTKFIDGKATEHWQFMQPADIMKIMSGPQPGK